VRLRQRLLQESWRREVRRDVRSRRPGELLALGAEHRRPQRRRLAGRVHRVFHEFSVPLRDQLADAQQPRREVSRQRVPARRRAAARRTHAHAVVRRRLRHERSCSAQALAQFGPGSVQGPFGKAQSDGDARQPLVGDLRPRSGRRSRSDHQRLQLGAAGARQRSRAAEDDSLAESRAHGDEVEPERARREGARHCRGPRAHAVAGRKVRLPLAKRAAAVFRPRRRRRGRARRRRLAVRSEAGGHDRAQGKFDAAGDRAALVFRHTHPERRRFMRKTLVAVFVVVLAARFFAQTPAPAGPLTLDAVAKALGASRGLTQVQFSATGSNNAYGQAWKADMPWPAFKIFAYTATVDYAVPAMRIDLQRSNPDTTPVRGGGGLPLLAPQQQIQLVSGKTAWNLVPSATGSAPAVQPQPAAVNDRLLALWTLTPQGVIKAAMANNATIAGRVISFKVGDTAVKATV